MTTLTILENNLPETCRWPLFFLQDTFSIVCKLNITGLHFPLIPPDFLNSEADSSCEQKRQSFGKFRKIHRTTPVSESLFNKVVGLLLYEKRDPGTDVFL